MPFVRPGRTAFDAVDAEALAGVDGGGAAVLEDGFSDAELMEFMAADVDPVPADPVFRDRLREQLWEMVVDERVAGRRPVAVDVSRDAGKRGPESA